MVPDRRDPSNLLGRQLWYDRCFRPSIRANWHRSRGRHRMVQEGGWAGHSEIDARTSDLRPESGEAPQRQLAHVAVPW